jgi:hypothetical protein
LRDIHVAPKTFLSVSMKAFLEKVSRGTSSFTNVVDIIKCAEGLKRTKR